MAEAIAGRLRAMQERGDIAPDADAGDLAATLLEVLHGQALAASLSGARPGDTDGRASRAVDVL